MPPALHSAAPALPGFFRLGHLQLPVFGLIASAGLIAALALSRRTAAAAGLDPQRLWDAGIVAVLSAFLSSRLLLVAVNARLFLHRPLLVLAQPSLTAGGLALTALIVWLWLRRHGLPLRRALDAWAAPAALLAAALQLGHFVEGTDAGMPTTLPWGVHTPGGFPLARVHPVQLYAAAGYLALSVCLWRAQKPRTAGRPAALGLLLGGVLSFALGFLRQPYALVGDAWLDPAQWAALAASAAGISLWVLPPPVRQTEHPSRGGGNPVKGSTGQTADSEENVLTEPIPRFR